MAITKVTNRVLDNNSVGVAQLSAGAVTLDKLITEIQQALLPVGAVQAFARTTTPAGWLICNGDAIGTTGTVQGVAASLLTNVRNMLIADTNPFGVSGSNPLLPDLRGIFVRGSGEQTISGITYNKAFATKERDAFQGHWHALSHDGDPYWVNTRGGVLGGSGFSSTVALGVRGATSDGSNGTPRTSSETRPANVALLYCIKF